VLTQIGEQEHPNSRSPRLERRLWHDDSLRIGSLGCGRCPERAICGGLEIKEPIFDCLDFCCHKPDACDKVCRNHPEYAGHVREIAGFGLGNVTRSICLPEPALPCVVPMLFHGSSRQLALTADFVALPLASMFNRRDGSARHVSRESLCTTYGINPKSSIILSGTDVDAPLERWWGFGESKRRELIRTLLRIGVSFTTTPNYSLFIDVPRWDDLHAMKRIALVHEEFQSEGLPAALHVNGRTDTDFRRWTEYLVARPEITHLAYEFTTGTGWAGRQELHATWLGNLAEGVGRPLTLVLRGGIEVLGRLASSFAHVAVIDTTSFFKTMMRKRASLNGRLDWIPAPTNVGAPVDDLLEENLVAVQNWIGKAMNPNGTSVSH
jgi:hypothetical protein